MINAIIDVKHSKIISEKLKKYVKKLKKHLEKPK
jgi:hypothetical protein